MEAASKAVEKVQARCCIVGGGPAGMMLGYLLARAGIEVLVLEKHADFLRDFRGDTIHPSTLEVMNELGILEELLKRPHQKSRQAWARIGNEEILLGDFSHLRRGTFPRGAASWRLCRSGISWTSSHKKGVGTPRSI